MICPEARRSFDPDRGGCERVPQKHAKKECRLVANLQVQVLCLCLAELCYTPGKLNFAAHKVAPPHDFFWYYLPFPLHVYTHPHFRCVDPRETGAGNDKHEMVEAFTISQSAVSSTGAAEQTSGGLRGPWQQR